MSQHPPFPPHLPRGAVAASALTLTNKAQTTVLRAGPSPAIQIPAAPSVPTVSVSVPAMPTALSRNPVITALRPATPPSTRAPSPAISVPDHGRTNLIVQGAGGAGALPGQAVLTFTQHLNPRGPAVPLGTKTVQVAQPGLIPHQRVPLGPPPGAASLAGIGVSPHLQPQAVLTASKPGLQVSGAMPAISISSLTPGTPTVVAPPSSIPIAKVTPQRQQIPLSTGLATPIAVQTMTSGSEYMTSSELGAMATQAGASQLLLSRNQVVTVAATSGCALASTIPAGVTSLAPHHADRTLQQTPVFNLTPAPAGAGGLNHQEMLQILYQSPQPPRQLVPAHAQQASIVRPAPNTFFLPRAGTDQSKMTSMSHTLTPGQSTVLFNAQMVVEGLRPPMGLNAAAAATLANVVASSSISTPASGGLCDGKPVISLSTSSGGQGSLHASLIAAAPSSGLTPAHDAASNTLHMAANLAAGTGSAGMTVYPHNLSSRATVASSIIAAASAHQMHPVQQHPLHTAASAQLPQPPGTPGGSVNANTNSSPRPSILRKRIIDGSTVIPRKPNFSMLESHSPRPDTAPPSNISSPKTPATENSQSSTDTALSSNDATTPTNNSQGDLKVKMEPLDGAENGTAASPAISLSGSITDASPRKRARKQLFDVSHRNVSEEVKGNSSSDEEMDTEPAPLKEIKREPLPWEGCEEYIDDEGVRWTRERTKPSLSIMTDYIVHWKPRLNHFQRHNEVRPKDDRNPTVNELISQKGILQKASGWKLFYVSAQVEDVIENEENMEQRIEKVKERLAQKVATNPVMAQDYNKLLELVRGNLQRCQVVRQQMKEANANMLNLLKHEPKIKDIITKNLAKRTIKKKERL